ncbi:MAG: chemotaxis response regulator protein-glutamate methylesterase [Bacteroidota bacterium]|nr:chemotaxis response regulator protein-glutamate methylesterase [Candidatus Kapabacteria bacterium]MDW8219414.1 chemotaxis response regulator protein-glutamate methylesterase [Bacteroidota bacterium]
MKPIRVLIVDDSAFVRKALSTMLQSEPDIEVVGLANNGKEAIEKTAELKPDIITLDVEMPVMNGLEALRIIMEQTPTPVLMVSSVTTEGAEATLEALSLGAVDFISKQSTLTIQQTMRDELVGKVKAITQSSGVKSRLARPSLLGGLGFRKPAASAAPSKQEEPSHERLSLQERIARRRQQSMQDSNASVQHEASIAIPAKPLHEVRVTGRKRPAAGHAKIVVLGVSTGGPLALHQVVPRLPKDFPVGMLIVQHMPAHFTKSLADRLNTLSHVTVREAQDGDILEPGLVLIAPGGLHMKIAKDQRTILVTPEPSDTLHRPSVDITTDSVVEAFGGHAIGVIMTGMGRDGCAGLKKLSAKGGYIIAQDEQSCVVYGMPKAVVDEGIADEVQPLDNLAEAIAACMGVHAVEAR